MIDQLNMLDQELTAKLEKLENILCSRQPLAIAFSGGVDSTFLLKFAQDVLGQNVMAVTADCINFAPDEIAYAKDFCMQYGIKHLVVEIPWDRLKSFSKNPKDRCYICKKNIFSTLISQLTSYANKVAFPSNFFLADGTNADDAFDYRPGAAALNELGILSPLLEAGLTKAEIRETLRCLGMPIWDKPAFACLASRIPYDEEITPAKLTSIYTVEKALMERGFRQVRVRYHQGDVGRIEILPEDRIKFLNIELMDTIYDIAKNAGFSYISLDLGGYKMGNMNVNI